MDTWHVACYTWHVTRDTWHVTEDTWHMTHRRALSGGVERGTNERPGIWSCDIWANERPRKKLHGEGTVRQTDKKTNGYRDSLTESAQWADSVKIHNHLGHLCCKVMITRSQAASFLFATCKQESKLYSFILPVWYGLNSFLMLYNASTNLHTSALWKCSHYK